MRIFSSIRTRQKPNFFICAVLAAVMLATNTSPALALKYWRAGRENKSSGTSIRWTGGHGYNYVMNNPTITYSHVNSMYIYRRQHSKMNYYEVGWDWPMYWDPVKGYIRRYKPHWFWAKMANNNYYGPHYGNDASPGTNHLLSVQIESNGKVQIKVDSGILRQETSNLYPDGQIQWGSERQNLNESNYAHFWGLMKRRHDYSWILWEDHREFFPVNSTPDPSYHWYSPNQSTGYSLAN